VYATNGFPSIDVTYAGGEAVCRISGDIDAASFGRLQERLAMLPGNGCTSVLIDCTAMTFLDVASARALQLRARALRADGIAVEIRGVTGVAERVLRFVAGDDG
jgi:anti-anti-sigma factor